MGNNVDAAHGISDAETPYGWMATPVHKRQISFAPTPGASFQRHASALHVSWKTLFGMAVYRAVAVLRATKKICNWKKSPLWRSGVTTSTCGVRSGARLSSRINAPHPRSNTSPAISHQAHLPPLRFSSHFPCRRAARVREVAGDFEHITETRAASLSQVLHH